MSAESARGPAAMTAAIISASPLLRLRLRHALKAEGVGALEIPEAGQFLSLQRKSPFLLCFYDVRPPGARALFSHCVDERPAERYIVLRAAWCPEDGNGLAPAGAIYGAMCEAFTEAEVREWAARARAEEQAQREGPPLEELLYQRFRVFLHQLGQTEVDNLHALVWERVERPLLTAVLEKTGGNQVRASKLLGIHRNTLRTKIKTLGLGEEGSSK